MAQSTRTNQKKKRGVVITTSFYTREFLKPLLISLKDIRYPVLIVSNGDYHPEGVYGIGKLRVNKLNEWELGGIRQGETMFEEFVHLMDTTLIKDTSLFEKLFEIPGHVVLTKGNYHYMGKFVSNDLPELPLTLDKEHAIQIETSWLPKPFTEFTPDLPVHTDVFETIHGQHRMRLENDYMIKWKGTYRI